MKSSVRQTLALLATVSVAGVLLTACSNAQEDVRITFCKNLTDSMLGSAGAVEWKGHENRFQRPEYAAITVRFEQPGPGATGSPMQATCFFEYNAVEEDAMTHSNPLSAYSTLPYQMTLKGQSVPQPLLAEAVKTEQKRMGRAVVDSVKKAGQDAVQYVKDGVDNAQAR